MNIAQVHHARLAPCMRRAGRVRWCFYDALDPCLQAGMSSPAIRPRGRVLVSKHKACTDIGKHPRTEHGLSDATTDEAQIRKWWTDVALRPTWPSGPGPSLAWWCSTGMTTKAARTRWRSWSARIARCLRRSWGSPEAVGSTMSLPTRAATSRRRGHAGSWPRYPGRWGLYHCPTVAAQERQALRLGSAA